MKHIVIDAIHPRTGDEAQVSFDADCHSMSDLDIQARDILNDIYPTLDSQEFNLKLDSCE